ESSLNKVYGGSLKNIGIITSGVVFQYAKEVFLNVPILKLGMTAPLPEKLIRDFAQNKKTVIVIEELEPYIEEQLAGMGLKARIIGKEFFPLYGELNPLILEKLYDEMAGKGIFKESGRSINRDNGPEDKESGETIKKLQKELPLRPPVLCAGCPHRPVFHILKKLKLKVMGDIGCYTLSVLPPLNSLDSCLCMGAGIGQALGMEKADPGFKGKIVSVIGDSTFFHSGITSLIDNVYNKGTGVIIILDNRITAMTGHQVNPGMGMTLMGEETSAINPEDIARAAGIKDVEVVDPYDMENFEKTVKKHLGRETLSVIITRQRCVLLDRKKDRKTEVYIDQEKCEKCGLCLKFGCPAIEYKDGSYTINQLQCSGCGVCIEICRKNAIICRESQ
ncbi:MAG TPA: indolepyruvate ferredoxin oxidoreductase subunit alpha, partial [Actinobacteria bacterium]|nr:indolepyruvate ferredoxin oxidoreductase subunit alpha [Actinomycetota bacterium]